MSRLATSSLQSLRAARRPTLPKIATGKKYLHETKVRNAIMMPAASPLWTEGAISRWMKKEGEAFAAGDVLLRIESDIYTVDVEAQTSGILGKILRPDGSQNVPMEEVIALVVDSSASPMTPSAPHTATPKTAVPFSSMSPPATSASFAQRPAYSRTNSFKSHPALLSARPFAEPQAHMHARAYSAEAAQANTNVDANADEEADAHKSEGSAIRRAIMESLAEKKADGSSTSTNDAEFDELL